MVAVLAPSYQRALQPLVNDNSSNGHPPTHTATVACQAKLQATSQVPFNPWLTIEIKYLAQRHNVMN